MLRCLRFGLISINVSTKNIKYLFKQMHAMKIHLPNGCDATAGDGIILCAMKFVPMYFISEVQRGTNWSTQSPTTGRISLTGQIDSPGKRFKLFHATLILNITPSAMYSAS